MRWLPIGGAAIGLVGCTLLYGDAPIGQCSTDAECEFSGTSGYRCDLTQRVCVSSLQNSTPSSDFRECRRPGVDPIMECGPQGCGIPSSEDCACLNGAWQEKDAALVGVIAPETLATATGARVLIPYVTRWERALALGLDEWSQSSSAGLLPRTGRPLAVLYCNSNGDPLIAKRAMTHLTRVANALAVITLADGDTVAVRDDAIASNRGVICSLCYQQHPGEANDTVWQIVPPLVAQATLAAWRINELASQEDSAEAVTVATVVQNYPGFEELASEVERRVSMLSKSQPIRVQGSVQSIIDVQPDVIFVAMDADFGGFISAIEAAWPAAEARPAYVLGYLNQELGLLTAFVGGNDDLRRRISGTGWWPGAGVSSNLARLEERFRARYGGRVGQTQYGYDAFYVAAHAIAWADRRAVVAAPSVAIALGHLQSGPAIDVGPDGISDALAEFALGQDINLVGSSNQLDWDSATRATRSDVTVWCLSRDPDGSLRLVDSAGPVWHAATGEVTGQYECP
jgi:ABC-type branched-subunit amino acid transport system substrate-binding protein